MVLFMLHPRGIFNSHNSHVQVNIWAGNVNDFLIGTYLLPQQLSAEIYHEFLKEKLPEMLEEILLSVRRNMWFQHGVAAAHFACQVQEHLTFTCNDHWIG
jgi:hypothetical protein